MANELVPIAADVPALVDPQGRPLRREVMEIDEAGPTLSGVRSVISGHPAQGLDPERLARILRQAEHGDATAYLELAEEMEEKDLHYLGVLGTRKRAVSQLPIEVTAAGDSDEEEGDAQFVRDWLERDTLEAELFDILDAVGKGYSVTELIWARDSAAWLPTRLETRDPRWFEFDRLDARTLRLKTDDGPQPLSAAKYITHFHPAKTGIPIRSGLARPVAWAYLFRNFSMKDWVTFSDAYGLPLRIGRYENGASEKNIRLLMSAIRRLGSDAAAVFPKSMEIEFQDGKSGDTGELFERLLVYQEQQISKAVLGQTGTTDATAGALATGRAHSDVREDIERADAKLLATTLNRDLVPFLVMFNRGKRARYPRIRIGRPDPIDVETGLKSIEAAVKFGVPVSVPTFRKVTGLAEPKDGEELLQAPAPNPPQGDAGGDAGADPRETVPPALLDRLKAPLRAVPERRAVARTEIRREPDAIDEAADEALGGWQRLIEPVVAPIEALADSAGTLEELRDGLADAIGRMGVEAFTEQLARAAFAARVAGDADVQTDERS